MNDDERYVDLLTNLKALELVVRALFIKSTQQADDPAGVAIQAIEGIIGALRDIRVSEAEARLVDDMEDHLRAFLESVDVELRDERAAGDGWQSLKPN